MAEPEVRTLQVAVAEGVEAKLREAGVEAEALGLDIREIIENIVVGWMAEELEDIVKAPACIITKIWPPGTPLYEELRSLISNNAMARRVLTGSVRWMAGKVMDILDLIDGEDDF